MFTERSLLTVWLAVAVMVLASLLIRELGDLLSTAAASLESATTVPPLQP